MDNASRHNFAGLRIIAFESRHAEDLRCLIEHHKGIPTVVPAMREVALKTTAEFRGFERALLSDELDMVIFLTGSGTAMLAREIERRVPRTEWTAALKRTSVVARGPKPIAVLRELGVPVALRVKAPHTWREVLATLDTNKADFPINQRVVAVQEYGMMNRNLLKGMKKRGAEVLRVPIYKWALPDDLNPLRRAVENIVEGKFDVVLFTSGTQVWHLFKVAAKKGMEEELRSGLRRMVVASVGPSTTEALREFDIATDLAPPQSKMGTLVKYAAYHAQTALSAKRFLVLS